MGPAIVSPITIGHYFIDSGPKWLKVRFMTSPGGAQSRPLDFPEAVTQRTDVTMDGTARFEGRSAIHFGGAAGLFGQGCHRREELFNRFAVWELFDLKIYRVWRQRCDCRLYAQAASS